MNTKEPVQYHRYSHRREWSLIILLLLLAVVSMVSAGQYALRMLPAWQVSADMSSLIDPDGTIAAYSGGSQIEPVDLQILTPFSFDYLTPAPSNAAIYQAQAPADATITETVHISTPTTTTTPVPSQTLTDRPTATSLPTKTRVVIYYTRTFTQTDAPVSTSTATHTFTRTFTPTNTASATRTSTPTTTSTATPSETSTHYRPTHTPSHTYTPTDSPTSTHTYTPTDTHTPTFTPTPTDTPIPSDTPLPSQTFTPVDTPAFTPTITSPNCSTNNPGAINIGPGDGNCTTITTGNDLEIDLGATPIIPHGDGNWDFIYYERAADPGIQMDYVTIEISSDEDTGIQYSPMEAVLLPIPALGRMPRPITPPSPLAGLSVGPGWVSTLMPLVFQPALINTCGSDLQRIAVTAATWMPSRSSRIQPG